MHHPALSPAAAREKSRLPATGSGGTCRSHRPGQPSRELHRGRTVAARENPSWQNRPWRSNARDEEAARRSRVLALPDRRVRHRLTPTNGGGGTDPWRTTPRPANTAPYPCRGEAPPRPTAPQARETPAPGIGGIGDPPDTAPITLPGDCRPSRPAGQAPPDPYKTGIRCRLSVQACAAPGSPPHNPVGARRCLARPRR